MPWRSPDYLSTVEAIYDLSLDEPDWLEAIASAARPWLDGGHGVMAWRFDASAPGVVKVGIPALVGGHPIHAKVPVEGATRLGAVNVEAYRRAGACASVSDVFGSVPPDWGRFYPPGIADFIGIFGRDPDHRGILLGAPQSAETKLEHRTRRRFSQTAVHLAAAFRLRENLGNERTRLLEAKAVEAVLAPTGECMDASLPAKAPSIRERLRERTMALERARGRLRRSDPDEALALWKGLLAGRWSLVETFDSDGRRFLVALRNDPALCDPRALTLRERQVAGFATLGYTNKLIAYALGLSETAVSLHLKTAAKKLGASSRTELLALLGGHGKDTPAPPRR